MKVTKQVYVAKCSECGEKFDVFFQTNETSKAKLNDLGQDFAEEWGGECISVKKFTPKVTKMARLVLQDSGEKTEVSLTTYNKHIAKFPVSKHYDYSKTEFFTIEEESPKDVWDCDATADENLAKFEENNKQ